ncbi:hypothetical protein R6Q59_014271 [Mikania micrantha]
MYDWIAYRKKYLGMSSRSSDTTQQVQDLESQQQDFGSQLGIGRKVWEDSEQRIEQRLQEQNELAQENMQKNKCKSLQPLGKECELKIGEIVYRNAMGTYTEEQIVLADKAMPLPPLDPLVVASVMIKGLTARLLVHTWVQGKIKMFFCLKNSN